MSDKFLSKSATGYVTPTTQSTTTCMTATVALKIGMKTSATGSNPNSCNQNNCGWGDGVTLDATIPQFKVTAKVAGAWNLNPHFLDALAERLRQALAALPPEVRDTTPVLLTCHSLPKRVVEKEPGYLAQIDQTVAAIVERVGLAADRWRFAYQSAGHTPEEWLTPDMKDLLPGLRARGHRHVVMAPVQFLADHLEILYDIDVAAREDAERQGISLHRIESLNLSPLFIAALADVVEETSPSLVELAIDQAER
jgi:ferrochelatase